MRESRDQKRRRKVQSRRLRQPVSASAASPWVQVRDVGLADVEDIYLPKEIASLAPLIGDCCVAYLGERRDGKRVIQVVEGTPCPECWQAMKDMCNNGQASSVFFVEEPGPAFQW